MIAMEKSKEPVSWRAAVLTRAAALVTATLALERAELVQDRMSAR
jgi:hypothetical protein